MFHSSRNNSRPNDIVPTSPTLRMARRQLLQMERVDYLEAHARALAANDYAMAACYRQMALAIDDQLEGIVHPFPLRPSLGEEVPGNESASDDDDASESSGSVASDSTVSPSRTKIHRFIRTPSKSSEISLAQKPSASTPDNTNNTTNNSTPRRRRQLRARTNSTFGHSLDPSKAKKKATPKRFAAGRTPFNSPLGVKRPPSHPSAETAGALLPNEEETNIIISTPRRGGAARIMSSLGKAVARLSPTRAYQQWLQSPDTSYDADVSSVESFMAVHHGSPGYRYRPCEEEEEEDCIATPSDTRSVVSSQGSTRSVV